MGKRHGISKGRLLITLSIIIQLTSCHDNLRTGNFYCDAKARNDVWRLPIAEPVELVKADFYGSTWNLATFPNYDPFFGFQTADSINFQKDKILLFSPYRSFVIIDLNSHTDIAFESRKDFNEYVKMTGLSSKLYHINTLYESWRNIKILPWANELSVKIECK